MMDSYDDRWGMHQGGGAWLMVLLMLILVAAVVVAVVALLRGGVATEPASGPVGGAAEHDPRAILQERFARGDIDESDFRARMRALDETRSASG